MDAYGFWQDLFDTYQSLSDWLKALWLIVPPLFLLGLLALLLHHRLAVRRITAIGSEPPEEAAGHET